MTDHSTTASYRLDPTLEVGRSIIHTIELQTTPAGSLLTAYATGELRQVLLNYLETDADFDLPSAEFLLRTSVDPKPVVEALIERGVFEIIGKPVSVRGVETPRAMFRPHRLGPLTACSVCQKHVPSQTVVYSDDTNLPCCKSCRLDPDDLESRLEHHLGGIEQQMAKVKIRQERSRT